MKSIKLIYYRGYNFGDVLSKYVVEKISGCKVQNKNTYTPSLLWQIKTMIKCLLYLNCNFFKEVTFFYEKPLMAIGSILSKGNAHSIVWGSGFMNKNEKFRGGKVYAVRGKYSNKMLQEQGYKGCDIFGDPAYLLPLLLRESSEKKYDISIIPHFTEYEYFKKKYSEKYNIINLNGVNIEKVVDEITSSKMVLSTSLHGIIVSHAYCIPALWIKKGYIETDGLKFYDYFSSVDIEEYDGYDNIEYLLNSRERIKELFEKEKQRSLAQVPIRNIQLGLLQVAPFMVEKKYLYYYEKN